MKAGHVWWSRSSSIGVVKILFFLLFDDSPSIGVVGRIGFVRFATGITGSSSDGNANLWRRWRMWHGCSSLLLLIIKVHGLIVDTVVIVVSIMPVVGRFLVVFHPPRIRVRVRRSHRNSRAHQLKGPRRNEFQRVGLRACDYKYSCSWIEEFTRSTCCFPRVVLLVLFACWMVTL